MEQASMEEIVAGYALGMLDKEEQAEAEQLIKTNQEARQLLNELQQVTGNLGLIAEPVELPVGSLNRLRQKAGIEVQPEVSRLRLVAANNEIPNPRAVAAPRPQKSGFPTPLRPAAFLAYAASAVLFITAAVLGLLLLNTENSRTDAERRNRELLAIVSAPNLKVTDLKPTGNEAPGQMRLYTDPATNKAYLVTNDLAPLPAGREYEAWLITGDNQPKKAAMLGSGGNRGSPTVYPLETNGEVEQYKLVAITVEKTGGVDKPSQNPILAGEIPA